MKQYAKYFKAGQKIQLKVFDPSGHFDTLTVYFHDHGAGHLDLTLPYRSQEGEGYPFAEGMPLELATDALGMGARIRATFAGYAPGKHDVIRANITGELQVFQRRTQRRVDVVAGMRFSRGQGTLRTFREQWRKNIDILQKANPTTLPVFPESQVNLSSGGLRLLIKPPVEKADIFLVLLQLQKEEVPVCVLAEVVWIGHAKPGDDRLPAGMQFIGVVESDRRKIESFVQKQAVTSAPK